MVVLNLRKLETLNPVRYPGGTGSRKRRHFYYYGRGVLLNSTTSPLTSPDTDRTTSSSLYHRVDLDSSLRRLSHEVTRRREARRGVEGVVLKKRSGVEVSS